MRFLSLLIRLLGSGLFIEKLSILFTQRNWSKFVLEYVVQNFFLKLFLHVSKSQYFFPIWILIVLIYYIWETSRNKSKKHSVTKNCSDLLLFKQIVLVISIFLKILGLHPRISNFFSQSLEQFFLRVGQNNFGNKIPFLFSSACF